jgi:TraM recognition site of TraD and TraG
MTLDQCKQKLKDTILQNPSLKDSLSKLATKAWETDKASCYDMMWWLQWVQWYVSSIKIPKVETPPTQNTTTEIPIDQQPSEQPSQTRAESTIIQKAIASTWRSQYIPKINLDIKQSWIYVLRWVLWILATIVLAKMIRYLFEFFYDVLNARRLTYLRITLPRWDDKISREQAKDVAKDMKEKLSRMGQVYDALHKLWQSSFVETWMRWLFRKPKVTQILHYEKWQLQFIIAIYPEYSKIVESGIAAQFPDASIETLTTRPKYTSLKYNSITVMDTKKNPVFPIKTYKQMPDDPLNNIIDTMGKMNTEDTFSIVIPIKPSWEKFNKTAKRWASGLYRKEKFYVEWGKHWFKAIILFPRTALTFILNGWKKRKWPDGASVQEWGKDMVRMTKAEEEALNIMGEEAGKHAFETWIILISSSNEQDRPQANLDNMISVFTIYRDEFNNELDNNEFLTDAMGWFFKPLWKFAARFQLTNFFYRKNIMTPNALTSLFHYPDGLYNRSPVIKWLDYKMLSPPDNLPEMKEPTDYIITWKLAEDYLWWDVSKILAWSHGRAVGEKEVDVEVFTDYIAWSPIPEWSELVEKKWKQQLKSIKKEKQKWFRVFKDGIFLWVNVYRNGFTPVYMTKKDRTRHHYVIWKSGWGKSVFIWSLARQDIWSGAWCCVIDPHGDLVEDILKYIPKERARDIVYFDAGNEERPMGLNLFDIKSVNEADRVVNDATEMFLKMFGPEIFGPRIQEYFKFGALTLLEDLEDPATLLDVPRLFTDDSYREYKTKKVKNPVVKNFWEKTYSAMGDREKQEIIPYFTSKFVSFNTNSLIRNIIGQTRSAFNFRQIMDEGKILLINLSKGKIGELNAQLLGMILVSNIYNAAMSRADIDEDKRRDFYLYVDEFQNFVTNTFADILSEARKYRLSLIMAHQYIAQLDGGGGNNIGESGWGKKSVKDAVFGNVGTMQSFKVWAQDAEFLEKEYAPVLSAQDIVWISNYKVYCKLNINNSTSRVFSMNTVWTKDYENSKAAAILQEYSSKKYWRKREYVEAEIQARLGVLDETPETPTTSTDIPTTSSESLPVSSETPTIQTENIVQVPSSDTNT